MVLGTGANFDAALLDLANGTIESDFFAGTDGGALLRSPGAAFTGVGRRAALAGIDLGLGASIATRGAESPAADFAGMGCRAALAGIDLGLGASTATRGAESPGADFAGVGR
jgi:hypothetical protein